MQIKLAYNRWGNADGKILLLFIHGHTSSKDTWNNLHSEFGDYDCWAIDLRGHGETELDTVDENYTFEALTGDIYQFLEQRNLRSKKCILVGHSMGSRVAVAYAASYPEMIAAVIIEDMEFGISKQRLGDLSDDIKSKMKEFQQFQSDLQKMTQDFEEFGFGASRVQKWINSGRIFQKGEGYWSGVHPWSSYLCWNQMLSVTCEECFEKIATNHLPTILFIAENNSSVSSEGLDYMTRVHPSLRIKKFPGSDHSIHNTTKIAYIEAINEFLSILNIH